ncbi:MAG: sugar phosphate isomerase/epimerase [Clostridiales bacterium]|nr:sugar phosphate isomerase/epimerase [Clostridiales bacterium]
MKYSLMSLMIDSEIKVTRPSFIHRSMAKSMGFEKEDASLDDIFSFLNERGIPIKNGTMDFEACVKFAKENGFDGIDMMSFHFEEEGKQAREILTQYDMTLSAVNAIIPFVNAVSREQFEALFENAKQIMDQAADAGCRNILLMPSVYRAEEGISREQAYHNIVSGLKACVAYGRKKGLTVTTETLESIAVPLCSNGEMLRLFADVPELQYTHDTGNPLLALENPEDTYEKFKYRVAAVHFKDLGFTSEQTEMSDVFGRHLQRVDFGTGEVDFGKHLQMLCRDDYQGFITLEGSVPAEDVLEGAVKSLQYFRNIEAEVITDKRKGDLVNESK